MLRSMPSSEESAAWVTLTRAPSLDIHSLSGALETCGPPHHLIDATDAAREHAGISTPAREFLASSRAPLSRTERAWLENPRHYVVPFTDPRYPELLRRGSDVRSHCTSRAMWTS